MVRDESQIKTGARWSVRVKYDENVNGRFREEEGRGKRGIYIQTIRKNSESEACFLFREITIPLFEGLPSQAHRSRREGHGAVTGESAFIGWS